MEVLTIPRGYVLHLNHNLLPTHSWWHFKKQNEITSPYPFSLILLPIMRQIHWKWWHRRKDKATIVPFPFNSSLSVSWRALAECEYTKKWKKNSWVHFVQHFHWSRKKKIKMHVWNVKCAVSMLPCMSYLLLYLHWKLPLHNIKTARFMLMI